MAALCRAQMKSCKVESADEALSLLFTRFAHSSLMFHDLVCSERAFIDLNMHLACCDAVSAAAAESKRRTTGDAADSKLSAEASTVAEQTTIAAAEQTPNPNASRSTADSQSTAQAKSDAADDKKQQTVISQSQRQPPEMNLIIRAWCDELDDSYEFRCFVYNGELQALALLIWWC